MASTQTEIPPASWVGLVAATSALAACGGGEDVSERLAATPSAYRPELLGLRRTSETGRESARAWRWPTPDEMMNWIEREYPIIFPEHATTAYQNGVFYRVYSNGNALGVQGDTVITYGPASGNELVSLGKLGDFAAMVLGASQPVSDADASRFLGQAAFGASPAHLAAVRNLGFEGWLAAQFAERRSLSHWDWMVANGYATTTNINNFNGVDASLWRQLITSTDVLRQRVTLALSEIFVVSMVGLPVAWRGMVTAAYMDTLEANAFGNYRQLLEAVTLSVGMGVYLNMRGNQKADGKGREPDENYAREVMQLFTIGLYQLNPDGTVKTVNGVPLESYSQDDIRGLARVFTGWDYDRYNNTVPDHAARPMVFNASRHSPETKQFLGVSLPAGTDGVGELRVALDTLANHPNVGPFFGRQLIQRLVTSNPSPAYVARVASAFANNGQGVRGDLQAVIRAVLLDPEARTPFADPSSGKLREPMVRFIQWARLFNASSALGLWNVGDTSNASTRLGQSPMRSPSVFNFFRSGYVPPGTTMGEVGQTQPEFQITNESTVVGYVNWMQGVVPSGAGEVKADYTPWVPLATDPGGLFDQLNLYLAAGQLSAATRATVVAAVSGLASATEANRLNRVHATVWLILCSPEYIVQK